MNVKLRYTGARSTKQAGVSLQPISKTLAHSDKEITKAYVITVDIANQTVGENS
jgi:phage integrase family protein